MKQILLLMRKIGSDNMRIEFGQDIIILHFYKKDHAESVAYSMTYHTYQDMIINDPAGNIETYIVGNLIKRAIIAGWIV